MKVDVLVAEIGSTTTVVNAFSGLHSGSPEFVGQGQATTTVEEGDVRIGLRNSIEDLKQNLNTDELTYDELFASSSAAGGLKMTVHGLVYDMTARAAREAALGAGGVIQMVTAGSLRRSDLKKIKESEPNIILIAGGVDYGERNTAIENSEKIRELDLDVPIIYAGNVENQEEIKLIFEDTDQEVYIVENVYPEIDNLNIDPTREVIQTAFEKHIIHAPGMEHIYDMVDGKIIPTPGAVMNLAQLVYEDIGDVVVLDVGGATTDMHSVTVGSSAIAELAIAPEPKAKRTVEGDLGLYVNLENIIELYGEDNLLEIGFDLERIRAEYDGIPKTQEERDFIHELTEIVVQTAVDRHAGTLRYVYGPSGRETLAQGKDLSNVKYVIGTGGALTQLDGGKEVLQQVMKKTERSLKLLPSSSPEVLIDYHYIIASLGVLAQKYESAALELLEKSIKNI